MIVVDASLATKWLLPEAGSAAALNVLKDHRTKLAAPDLLMVEVAGAIVRRVNERAMSEEEGRAASNKWRASLDAGDVLLHRTLTATVSKSSRIAMDLGHPLKDCVYLALAVELDCPLVTCDARFRDRAASAHPRVRLLAEAV